MGQYRILAAALCAAVALCGCTVFGAPLSTSGTSGAGRASLQYTPAQDPELASADELPFDKQGLLECDGRLLDFGSEHEDPSTDSHLRFTAPVLVRTADSDAALPVYLMKNSKIYNESGDRITGSEFCAHMFMSDDMKPIRTWHMTIRLDEADRMTLVKATPADTQ